MPDAGTRLADRWEINYSHPVELAAVIRQFLGDERVTGPEPAEDISPIRSFRGGR